MDETEKSINLLTKIFDKNADIIKKCIRQTSEIHRKSFSTVLNIVTYDWMEKTLRWWPQCNMCGLPKEKYEFPCRVTGSLFLDYKELKEWCDLKEGRRKIVPSKEQIPRRKRLKQARKEFEKEKEELEEKRRKSSRVRFDI